jgi:hypothetical protein
MKIGDKWYLDHCKKIHKKKLLDIKSHTSKRIDHFLPISLNAGNLRLSLLKHHRSADLKSIAQENQNIFERIMGITTRQPKKQVSLYSLPKSIPITKSISKTKIQTSKSPSNKIDFSSISPTFSYKKFEIDYEKSQKTKKILQKKHGFFTVKTQKTEKLPPIKSLQKINILKPDSSEMLELRLPSKNGDLVSMTPLEDSYVKVITPGSHDMSIDWRSEKESG